MASIDGYRSGICLYKRLLILRNTRRDIVVPHIRAVNPKSVFTCPLTRLLSMTYLVLMPAACGWISEVLDAVTVVVLFLYEVSPSHNPAFVVTNLYPVERIIAEDDGVPLGQNGTMERLD